jgi:hypothetical protein
MEILEMAERKCSGDHMEHICEIASHEKFGEIKELAKNPKYMCFNCGRVADEEKNLCYPIEFDKIPMLNY